jgi:hypothetical protein
MNVYRTVKSVLDISPLDVVRALRRRLTALPFALPNAPRRLSSDQTKELDIMRHDNRAAGPPFAPSLFWRELLAKRFDYYFQTEGIQNPEEHELNLCFSGFSPGDVRLHRYVCWLYLTILQRRDTLGLIRKLSPTCREEDGFAYRFGEFFVSLDLLLSIDDFYSLYELNPKVAVEPIIVAELGAGWGRLGYVLCKANPNATYVIFDLPEILLISQSYLPTLLPDTKAMTYESNREISRIKREELLQSKVWFFGTQDVQKLQECSVDLFVNIASFQEMPREYVATYLTYIGHAASGGGCFFRQLKDRRIHGHHREEIAGVDQYSFPSTWKCAFLRSSTISNDFFEAGFSIPQQAPR